MKLVSCSKCMGVMPAKQTVIMDHKRICRECRKKKGKND